MDAFPPVSGTDPSGSALAECVLRGKGMWHHALPLAGGGEKGASEGRACGRQHRHVRSCYIPGGRGGRHQEEPWSISRPTFHSQARGGPWHLQHLFCLLSQERIFMVKFEELWRTLINFFHILERESTCASGGEGERSRGKEGERERK